MYTIFLSIGVEEVDLRKSKLLKHKIWMQEHSFYIIVLILFNLYQAKYIIY